MSTFYDNAFDKFVQPRIEAAVPTNATGWQLYSGEPGADEAAAELSAELQLLLTNTARAFLAGCKRLEACREKHGDVGAADTEPRVVMEDAIATVLRYLTNGLF